MASPLLPVLTQIQGQKPRPTNPLVDWLMSMIGTGWGEGTQTSGVRPGYGLGTATGISPQQGSPYEPTLAPGQWQQMSPEQKQVRTLGQLGNIILSGPGIAEVLPRNVMPVASGAKNRAAMGWGRPPGSRPAPLQDVMANVQAPPFYSQARKVVEDPKTQGTQTGEAWSRFLTDPKRGVKAEEMKWTGLGEFLKSKSGERVTREEIQSHLDANEIQVKEVTKGAKPFDRDAESIKEFGKPYSELDARQRDWIAGVFGQSGLPPQAKTKFSSYALPGAENYREVLLTMPAYGKKLPPGYNIRELPNGAAILEEPDGRGIASFPTRQGLMDALPRILQTREEPNADQFRGGHWDEPNVLAHLRLSDRTVGGKRTLLVEELQSDWAQKGRREGFQEPIDQSKFPTYEQWLEAEITPEARKDEAVNRRVYENDKSRWLEAQRKGIPQAPFVTDTGKWTALGLKRVLKMAADEGYDAIGIVPGAEQAKRYDLSKRLKTVVYVPEHKYFRAQDHEGNWVIERAAKPEELVDLIGKDLAEKLLAAPVVGASPYTGAVGKQTLSGLDLQVGGEGMKGYYDKIVPDTLNKLAKEYGVKVQLEGGKVPLNGPYKIEPSRGGGFLFDVRDHIDQKIHSFQSEAEAEAFIKKLEEHRQEKGTPIHTLEVPEQMKKQIKAKGFPLYSKTLQDTMAGLQRMA